MNPILKSLRYALPILLATPMFSHGAALPNEGFGVETIGGGKGKVFKVTNLYDTGTGSLRAALADKSAKTIVFEVGGTITLSKDLLIQYPNVTIAGETAPSPGITITNGALRVRTNDVIVRHLRFRVGDNPNGPSPENRDGIGISGSDDGTYKSARVVIDHCSVAWAIDENISTWYKNVSDITVRYSIVAEGLDHSLHPKGQHSTGLLIGDYTQKAAVIGNLFAHNRWRNPYMKGATSSMIVNNYIYDPGDDTQLVNDAYNAGPAYANTIGNVFKPGPSTNTATAFAHITGVAAGTQLYYNDNVAENGKEFWIYGTSPVVTQPLNMALNLTIRPSAEVPDFVLTNAGARPADRDAVDKRIVNEVTNGTGSIIDSPTQVGGLPVTAKTTRKLSVPSDPLGDADGDGISNLAEWLEVYRAQVEPK